MKKSGNLLTGALRPSLEKEFWKGDPVQGQPVTETGLQASGHLWKWLFFAERGYGRGSGGLVDLYVLFAQSPLKVEIMGVSHLCKHTHACIFTLCIKSVGLVFLWGGKVEKPMILSD